MLGCPHGRRIMVNTDWVDMKKHGWRIRRQLEASILLFHDVCYPRNMLYKTVFIIYWISESGCVVTCERAPWTACDGAVIEALAEHDFSDLSL